MAVKLEKRLILGCWPLLLKIDSADAIDDEVVRGVIVMVRVLVR